MLSTVTPQTQNAIRSQRDLMMNVTIDQLPLVGVNLGNVIFNNGSSNYTESLMGMQSLMAGGVQSFVLDLEPTDSFWIVKETDIDFMKFLLAFDTFVNRTDDNLSANILVLHLNISTDGLGSNKSSNYDRDIISVDLSKPMLNMTYLLDQAMGQQRIYTPLDLQTDQQQGNTFNTYGKSSGGWPTLDSFLFSKRKRVIVTEISNRLNSSEVPYIFNNTILHYDVGNKTLETPGNVQELVNTSTISWRFLEAEFSAYDIKEYIDMGYSPIIANHYNFDNLTKIKDLLENSVIWSWGTKEPITTHTATRRDSGSLVAYNCAALKYFKSNSSASWSVDNCYERHHGLCRYSDQAFEWEVTEADDTYFAFDRKSECHCSDMYQFALPRTPLEQSSVLLHLKDQDVQNENIWIDLNSISVSDCWVSGGPYATCPYQKVVPRRNFVAMLTPVTVCCFVILLIVSYLNLLRLPIHSNRKNWRRIVNDFSKTALDGVPS